MADEFPNRCFVCNEPFRAGDEIVFRVVEPLPVGSLPTRCLWPLHEACGMAHAEVTRRRQQQEEERGG